MSEEQVAHWAVDRRNQLKNEYRDLTPQEDVAKYEARNLEKYQNPLGPTIDQLRAKEKSWQEIIEGRRNRAVQVLTFRHQDLRGKTDE
jgi:hypothetical protein